MPFSQTHSRAVWFQTNVYYISSFGTSINNAEIQVCCFQGFPTSNRMQNLWLERQASISSWQNYVDKVYGFFHSNLWNKIYTPKSFGGLGIKKTRDMNLALISKLGWMMTSSTQRPWITCLRAKYLKNFEFLQVDRRSSSSWIWKGLLKSRFIISQGRCFLVGTGDTIRTWLDP